MLPVTGESAAEEKMSLLTEEVGAMRAEVRLMNRVLTSMRKDVRRLKTRVRELGMLGWQMELDEEEMMRARGQQIFVRCQSGCMVLEILESETIFDLRMKIMDREGIPTEHQLLVYASQQLEDDKNLADYSIGRDATLHLVLQLRAGMQQPPPRPLSAGPQSDA